ncbi:MAG: DUF4886 domain-containing protein [Fluviicola sp.]
MKNIRNRILLSIVVLTTSLLSFKVTAQENPKDPSKTSYLFIGNSFTYFNEMPKMFDAIATNAGKNVYVKSDTKGGADFAEHSQRPSVYKSIKSHKWDNVILQGYSREFIHASSHVDTATIPYLNQILDSIYANNPCTNVYFYMTWGYEKGYGDYEYTKDFEGMADTIHGGYMRIGDYYQLPVVPVGKVWKNVKTNSRANLYNRDKFHPSKKGSYLAAATFFSAFYDEENQNYRPRGISKKMAEYISQQAYELVHENRAYYSLDEQESLVHWKFNEDGTVDARFRAAFPEALSYKWTIDGAEEFSKSHGSFVFADQMNHRVELEVTSKCGSRNYTYVMPLNYYHEANLTRREKRLLRNKK